MKKLALFILMAACLGSASAVETPTTQPTVTYVTTVGSRSTATSKKRVELYVKSRQAGDKVIIDFGKGAGPQEVAIPKAYSLVHITDTTSLPQQTVRLWASSNLSSLNLEYEYITTIKAAPGSSLDTLNIANNQLTDLSFLSAFPGLKYLKADKNPFTTLTLNAPSLLTLYLDKCTSLSTLSLTAPKLLVCDLEGTQLTSFDASGFPELKSLRLMDNHLFTQVKLADAYPQLNYLLCSGSGRLRSLKVTNCPLLRYATINADTLLNSFVIENVPKLFKLHLQRNSVKSLTLKDCPEMLGLYLDNSGIEELHLANVPSMVDLFVENTRLTDLNLMDTKCVQLCNIKARNCRLRSIEYEDTVHNYLTQLLISGNYIPLVNLPRRPALIKSSTGNYAYAPQHMQQIKKDVSVKNDTLDFSDYAYGWGTTGRKVNSAFKVVTKFDEVLTPGTDYELVDGCKIVFLKENMDSVAVEVTNSAFHDFTGANALRTNFAFINKPSGVTDVAAAAAVVAVRGSEISISAAQGEPYVLTDSAGRILATGTVPASRFTLQPGIQGVALLRVGTKTTKVLIK